jgi:dihydrofolate reductase
MARKTNAYKKFVFSKTVENSLLEWNNSERVITTSDADFLSFIRKLKAQSGGDIHLAGGPRLVRTFVRLSLIDAYHFFVFPVVSAGFTWYDGRPERSDMRLISSTTYQNGIVGMFYESTGEIPALA